MERYSKPRDPQGNFDQMRLLDARLSLESMLVRETVQNAWDARDPDRGEDPVEWGLRFRSLRGQQRNRLRSVFSDIPAGGLPPAAAKGRSLRAVLKDTAVDVLFVDDRNTRGLTGPPASHLRSDPLERRFARFMLDMGRPPGIQSGGGTYGYGKTVLWRTSECATILAFSRFHQAGQVHSRLMGAAMGDPYEEGGAPMTGRHWWGRLDDECNVLPLEGRTARAIAHDLGMWDMDDRRTGTTVLVVGSRFGRDDVPRLREAARWHCWPKWSEIHGEQEMDFRFSVDDRELPVLDSSTDPMIGPFASALEKALSGEGEACEILRPHIVAGRLVGTLGMDRRDPSPGQEDDDIRPVTLPINHVALVRRGPRLHIRFEEYPDAAPDGVVRAGVFLTAEDQGQYSPEGAFARAEPPTHDDWSWRGLTGTDKTVVRTGLQRLREAMRGRDRDVSPSGTTDGMGRLANRLGTMLDEGAGPSSPKPQGGGGNGRRPDLRVRESSVGLQMYEDETYITLEFDLEGRAGRRVRLRPSVRVVDGDRRSTEAEEYERRVEWVHWEEGLEIADGEMELEPDWPDDGWTLWVPMPEPRRLRVSVVAEAVDG